MRPTLAVSLALAITMLATGSAEATAPVGTNGRIVYGSSSGGSSDVFTINPDGTGATNLTHTPDPISEAEPSWSPTGAQIAFSLCNAGACDIAVMNPDGSGILNLTNTPAAREQRPAFSPDGQLIAYDHSDSTGDQSIWVMNRDGTNQHRLTNTSSPDADFTPDFSPDGNTITYTHCTGGPSSSSCNIGVMNADGSAQRNLTNSTGPVYDLGGSFSPTGASIVFQVNHANNDLALMNADGSGRRDLINTSPTAERRPVFSGDGMRLAFGESNSSGAGSDIFVSDLNAQGQVNLTKTPAASDFEQNPDWEDVQMCGASRATIVGDDGPDKLFGTAARDVIDANAATTRKNKIKSLGGNDLICVGAGKAKVNCGKGKHDKVISLGKGKRKTKGCERTKGKGFKKPAK
jgi:Tol biopolymer transport system component